MSIQISDIPALLKKRYANPALRKRAVFLRGASGIGKSEAVYQVGLPVVDIRLSQQDPTDMKGVPEIIEHITHWATPAIFPTSGEGIIFLDEITSAPPAVQASAYQLILDRRLGDYHVPDGWMIVAAGNLTTDRGVTYTIASPLMNRMTVFDVVHTLDGFIEWAATNGVSPKVMAFVSDRADLLHKFTAEHYGNQFPSPRGWSYVSHTIQEDWDSHHTLMEQLIGDVGKEAAMAFDEFLRVWDKLPSINSILAGDDVDVPHELDQKHCITMGVSARLDRKNFDKAWGFLKKLPKDLRTLCIKLAILRDEDILQARLIGEWSMENQDVFRRSV